MWLAWHKTGRNIIYCSTHLHSTGVPAAAAAAVHLTLPWPAGPVLNNTQVTVACTKPDPAGWPEAGYTVRVTATAGDADCLGSGQSDTTIYRSNKPVISVISVVGPTNPGLVLGKVCSEEQSKDFAFYLTSTTTSTITITDIKTTPTTTCQLFPTQTTPATGESRVLCLMVTYNLSAEQVYAATARDCAACW